MKLKLVDRWESLGFPGKTVNVCPILRDVALDVMADGDFTALHHQIVIKASGSHPGLSIQRINWAERAG